MAVLDEQGQEYRANPGASTRWKRRRLKRVRNEAARVKQGLLPKRLRP